MPRISWRNNGQGKLRLGFKGLQRASSANFCWEVVCERWLVEIPVEMSQMSSNKCLLWFCGLVEGCSIPMIGSYHLETFGNHFETELWLALDSIMAIYWLQLSIAQLQGVHHCRSPIGIIDINLKISQEPRFKEFSQLQRGKVPEGLPGTVTSSWQEYTGFGGEIPWFWTVVSYSTSYFVTSKSKLHLYLYLSIYIYLYLYNDIQLLKLLYHPTSSKYLITFNHYGFAGK